MAMLEMMNASKVADDSTTTARHEEKMLLS